MPAIISRATAKAAGLDYYFNGLPCQRCGHISERFVQNYNCVACSNERCALQYKANIEYRRKYARDRAAANPEVNRARARKWLMENRERGLESRRLYRLKNLGRLKEVSRRWRRSNKDVRRALEHKRRAISRGAAGKFTAEDVAAIAQAQRHKCAYCRVSLRKAKQIDHIIPLSRGGSNWPSNLQLLCSHCNQSKGAKLPEEFAQARQLLL